MAKSLKRPVSGVAALLPACAAALLPACAMGPDFHRPTPPAGHTYGAPALSAPTVAIGVPGGEAQRFVADMNIPGQWWTLFRSGKLDALVAQALAANPDADAARAALRQAHELYAAQRAGYFPSLAGNFNATRAQNATGTIAPLTVSSDPTYNLYTAQLSLGYTPDVFGGTRRAVEAAGAGEELSRFQLEATYLTLSSNVVVTVLQEATLRGQIAATQRLLVLQQQLTDAVRRQRAAGTASDVDVLAQESAQAQTAAMLPPLTRQLGQTRDALTALLGRLPAAEPADEFQLSDLTLPQDLPLSLPSRLVEQRPDVLQAQANLHVASALAGVALADMLPQFSIDAGLGSSALAIGSLFSPYTGFWSLGGSLTQALFDAGALLHRKRAADAALDEAAAQYRAAVIQACQNVADTLRALQADADALRANAAAEQAARRTFDLAVRQHALGTVSTTAVINAEQSYRQAGIGLVLAQANRYMDTAALFQALGGGWWNRQDGGNRREGSNPQGGAQ